MIGFIIFILQSPIEGAVALPIGSEFGVKITLENTVFEEGKEVKWETRITKLGEKLRIDETFPNSEEIGQVIIWDGKQCRLFIPDHKPQTIPPIRNGLEFLGFNEGVKEEGVKWEVDKVNKVPLKKEMADGITQYKDYVMIEYFGFFPSMIERHEKGKLDLRTELKHTDKKLELSGNLFNSQSVEFSEEAKKLAKELRPE